MIYCIRFAQFERYLNELGYGRSVETDRDVIYERADDAVVVRKPNVHGDITELEMIAVCDAAGIDVPNIAAHWCD